MKFKLTIDMSDKSSLAEVNHLVCQSVMTVVNHDEQVACNLLKISPTTLKEHLTFKTDVELKTTREKNG